LSFLKNILSATYRFINQSRLYHLFFWFLYAFIVAVSLQPGRNLREWLLFSCLILTFHAAVSYVNNYYFVNRYLYTRQYVTYVIVLILTIAATAFPISVIIHKLVNNRDLKNMVWSWNFFILIALSVLFSVVLSMVLKLLKNWYQGEQARKRLQQINTETELKFLKSQINPHFLFNCLNNLYALTLKKSDLAPEVVLRLSNILRYVLYEAVDGRVPLSKEVAYLKDYIDLEKIRLGSRAEIDFETEGDLEDAQIEPMLFLTFLENSVKHGAFNTIADAWIKIKLQATASQIVFEISNSKPAGMVEQEKGQGGIGMANLKKRLDIIYPEKYTLEVKDGETEYHVKLALNS
jgi:two-component system LytT family sensor kinase